MFSIECAALSDFDEYDEILAALGLAKVFISSDAPSTRPSYHFDYREVGLDNVKRVLGYAGIAVTNTPLGVGGSFDPIAHEGEWVVFPLEGLRRHFEGIAEGAVRDYERFGSLDRVIEARGPDVTPGDQLVVAILECLRFCEVNSLVLTFAW